MSLNSSALSQDSVWQWREWSGLPYLTCELLQNWQHGFFTQHYSPRLPEDLVGVLSDRAQVYRVKQVHGNTVLDPQKIVATSPAKDAKFPDADGIITDDKQQSVWVASADCNPVLIADRQTGKVAAIHAGWRGTAQKIVPNAIASFQAKGSNLPDLLIAIGPAISGSVYQVGENVAAEVGKSILSDWDSEQLEDNEAVLNALFKIRNSPILEDEQPKRVKLDVKRVNQIQLQQLGIDSEQIAIAPYCTYQQPDHFFSYRRTKQKKVQWSGIVSNT